MGIIVRGIVASACVVGTSFADVSFEWEQDNTLDRLGDGGSFFAPLHARPSGFGAGSPASRGFDVRESLRRGVALETATWTGNGDGLSWMDDDNWSTGSFPDNNGTLFDAVIGSGFSVATDNTGVEIQSLSLGMGSTLSIGDPEESSGFDDFVLNADSTNNGTIELLKNDIRFESDALLDGDGVIELGGMSSESDVELISTSGADLTIGADQTVRTGGTKDSAIIDDFGVLTNNGAFEAVGGRDLLFNEFGDNFDVVNNSLLRVRDNGRLEFSGVDVDQTGGGRIEIESGSIFWLTDPDNTITGGSIEGSGTFATSNGPTLDGVTIESGLSFDLRDLAFTNTVTNNADITSTRLTEFIVEGDALLDGTGALRLQHFGSFDSGPDIVGDADSELTIGAMQSLIAEGENLESEIEVDVVNEGTFDVMDGEVTMVDSTLTNRSLVRVRDGAELSGSGITVDGGTVTVDAGGSVGAADFRLENATINGTTSGISPSGTTLVGTNTFDVPVEFQSVTVEGNAEIGGAGEVVNGIYNASSARGADSVTFASGMTLTVENNTPFNLPMINEGTVDVLDTLRLNDDATNDGTITIGDGAFGRVFVEQSLAGGGQVVLADEDTATLNIEGATISSGVTGAGLVRFGVSGGSGGQVTNVSGPFSNTGETIVEFDNEVTFTEPAGALGELDVRFGATARFESGVGDIAMLSLDNQSELFVQGDTSILSGVESFPAILQGTMSGPGTTTFEGWASLAGVTLDGRTALANAEITGGALDLINGARFINAAGNTFDSTSSIPSAVDSSDGSGVLENRGTLTGDQDIFAFFEQTSTGTTMATDSMDFTGGGTIDGDVITTSGFGSDVEYSTDGGDVTYTFPETSSIEGAGDVSFVGPGDAGDGSVDADINGEVNLSPTGSTFAVRDGASVSVDVTENTSLGSDLEVSDGATLDLALDTSAGRSANGGDSLNFADDVVINDGGAIVVSPNDDTADLIDFTSLLIGGEFRTITGAGGELVTYDVPTLETTQDGTATIANSNMQTQDTTVASGSSLALENSPLSAENSLTVEEDAELLLNAATGDLGAILQTGADSTTTIKPGATISADPDSDAIPEIEFNGETTVKESLFPNQDPAVIEDVDVVNHSRFMIESDLEVRGGTFANPGDGLIDEVAVQAINGAAMLIIDQVLFGGGSSLFSVGEPDASGDEVTGKLDATNSQIELEANAEYVVRETGAFDGLNADFFMSDQAILDMAGEMEFEGGGIDASGDSSVIVQESGVAEGDGQTTFTLSGGAGFSNFGSFTNFSINMIGDTSLNNSGSVTRDAGGDGGFSFGGRSIWQTDTDPTDSYVPYIGVMEDGVMVAGFAGDFGIELESEPEPGVDHGLLDFNVGGEYEVIAGESVSFEYRLSTGADGAQRGDTPLDDVGSVSITSDTVMLGSTLTTAVDVAGTGAGETHDLFEFSGMLNLGGSTLELSILDGFEEEVLPGDTFEIFTSDGLFGEFANASPGERLFSSDGLGSFVVNYGPDSPFNPDSVVLSDFLIPAPSSAALALIGLSGAGRRRRAST